MGRSGGGHSGAAEWLLPELCGSGSAGDGAHQGQRSWNQVCKCSAQRLICVVGWSLARWVKCSECSGLWVSWPCPLQTWPGGGLGSVNFYNLFKGHLERDFDGHKNNITLEPDNPSWGNSSWGKNQQKRKAACLKVLSHCVWLWKLGNDGVLAYICHLSGLLQQACDEGVSQVRKLSLRFGDSLRSLVWSRNKKKAKCTAGLSGQKARRHSSGAHWMRACSAGKRLSNWLWINSVEFSAVILSDNYGNSVATWKYLRHVNGSNGLYKFTYVTILPKMCIHEQRLKRIYRE